MKAASESLDELDRLDPTKEKKKETNKSQTESGQDSEEVTEVQDEEADEEIVSSGAAKAQDTSAAARRQTDIERIRSKALLRRGKARSELGGWSALAGAEEGALDSKFCDNTFADKNQIIKSSQRCRSYRQQTGR